MYPLHYHVKNAPLHISLPFLFYTEIDRVSIILSIFRSAVFIISKASFLALLTGWGPEQLGIKLLFPQRSDFKAAALRLRAQSSCVKSGRSDGREHEGTVMSQSNVKNKRNPLAHPHFTRLHWIIPHPALSLLCGWTTWSFTQ